MDRKKLCPSSWLECPTSLTLPISFVTDNGTQTDNITCNHEEEINKRVKSELNVIQQQLLKFNRDTLVDSCKGA